MERPANPSEAWIRSVHSLRSVFLYSHYLHMSFYDQVELACTTFDMNKFVFPTKNTRSKVYFQRLAISMQDS